MEGEKQTPMTRSQVPAQHPSPKGHTHPLSTSHKLSCARLLGTQGPRDPSSSADSAFEMLCDLAEGPPPSAPRVPVRFGEGKPVPGGPGHTGDSQLGRHWGAPRDPVLPLTEEETGWKQQSSSVTIMQPGQEPAREPP